MLKTVRSSLVIAFLCALPAAAADVGKPQAASRDGGCSISVKKGDLVSRGTKLRVEGDQSTHDAVALDGDVVVRAGATVKDVVAMRGAVKVEAGARVTGDVTTLGGDIHIAEGAVVEGKVAALGGRVHAAPGAKLLGDKNELSVQFNGMDPFQMLWDHILSEKGAAHCTLHVTGE